MFSPQLPGGRATGTAYLGFVDDIYKSDAYHSLSIEGYRVTTELIERVQSGDWNPEHDDADRGDRNALAARGYWQAFQLVKDAVAAIIGGDGAGNARSRRASGLVPSSSLNRALSPVSFPCRHSPVIVTTPYS